MSTLTNGKAHRLSNLIDTTPSPKPPAKPRSPKPRSPKPPANSTVREAYNSAIGSLTWSLTHPPRMTGGRTGLARFTTSLSSWTTAVSSAVATIDAGGGDSRRCADGRDREDAELADYLLGSDSANVRADRKAFAVKPS